MKNIIFKILFLLSISSTCLAVLPPLYQSIEERKAILSSEELPKHLGSHEVIEDIVNVSGGYIIITNYSHLKVNVVYIPTEMLGPAHFNLVFETPIETEK